MSDGTIKSIGTAVIFDEKRKQRNDDIGTHSLRSVESKKVTSLNLVCIENIIIEKELRPNSVPNLQRWKDNTIKLWQDLEKVSTFLWDSEDMLPLGDKPWSEDIVMKDDVVSKGSGQFERMESLSQKENGNRGY